MSGVRRSPSPWPREGPYPFLDLQSFQTDFLDGYCRGQQSRCWLFERRQEPVVVSDEVVDPGVTRGALSGWPAWLCQFGSALRAVRVDSLGRGELQTLCAGGVQVRLVSEDRAARSVLPDMLLLGLSRAYVFVYEEGVFAGAVRVDDTKLVARWRAGVDGLYADGAHPGEEVQG